MTRQYLLDQGGSGTQHADDEYWNRRGVAHALLSVQEIGSEDRAHSIERPQSRWLVVAKLSSSECISFEKMAEGTLVLFEIRIGFAEREMQFGLIDERERCHVSRQLLHGRELMVACDNSPRID